MIFKETDRKRHIFVNAEITLYYLLYFHLFGFCFHGNSYWTTPRKILWTTGKPVRKGKLYKRGVKRNDRIRGCCPYEDSGQNRTQMHSPTLIPAAADFILSQYIRLPDKVKLCVSSGSLPEKSSRSRHVLSFVCF